MHCVGFDVSFKTGVTIYVSKQHGHKNNYISNINSLLKMMKHYQDYQGYQDYQRSGLQFCNWIIENIDICGKCQYNWFYQCPKTYNFMNWEPNIKCMY